MKVKLLIRVEIIAQYVKPFPSYDNSAADDFEHILSKNKNLYN